MFNNGCIHSFILQTSVIVIGLNTLFFTGKSINKYLKTAKLNELINDLTIWSVFLSGQTDYNNVTDTLSARCCSRGGNLKIDVI